LALDCLKAIKVVHGSCRNPNRIWDCGLVVERWPSMCEALAPSPLLQTQNETKQNKTT
jgi:hypothetical protein